MCQYINENGRMWAGACATSPRPPLVCVSLDAGYVREANEHDMVAVNH